jgi:hypothetical protein
VEKLVLGFDGVNAPQFSIVLEVLAGWGRRAIAMKVQTATGVIGSRFR